jgi:glycosyltransferase involved in cell wall biosynthesis
MEEGFMRILIIHFRSAPTEEKSLSNFLTNPDDSAGTDGVSLEIMKREKMLNSMGHEVAISSAYDWSDYPIKNLEFDSIKVMKFMKNLFGEKITDFSGKEDLKITFEKSTLDLKRELFNLLNEFRPDILFVHNILSLPVHPVATVALTQILKVTRIPCVAIHHDILSEGAYKFTPTCQFANTILENFFPPQMTNLMHWTINTRNQKTLEKRGIEAKVIHDSIDFDKTLPQEEQKRISKNLREKHGISMKDIVLLVGARIVPNKQIELAGHITSKIKNSHDKLINKKLYNRNTFSKNNKIWMVLAGRPEIAFQEYRKKLYQLFDKLGIDWIYIGDEVGPIRIEKEGFYSLYPDIYSIADLVLYPTRWEGFGNQLIEAFASHLPTIVYEYPVFKEDIKPKGFEIISLGDEKNKEFDPNGFTSISNKIIENTADQTIKLLTDQSSYKKCIEHNFELGKRHFGYEILKKHLNESINWATSQHTH